MLHIDDFLVVFDSVSTILLLALEGCIGQERVDDGRFPYVCVAHEDNL